MRQPALHGVAAISVAAILLSGCSGSSQGNASAILPTSIENHTVANRGARTMQPANTARRLYVVDYGNGDVAIINYHNFANIGKITPPNMGLFGWVDKSENLYTANGTNVTEYDSTGNLTFTYRNKIGDPFDVTTNQYGDVFVTNGDSVIEYLQKVDHAAVTCSVAAYGVAVDRAGDVFVNSGQGLAEFRHGLLDSNCMPTTLPVTFKEAEGMAFDTQGNLIVCDFNGGAVDVIAPPYTAITGTLGSGFKNPFGISIDKEGTQAYVSDVGLATVSILDYPSGFTTATLGSGIGLNRPYDALDSKNYVP